MLIGMIRATPPPQQNKKPGRTKGGREGAEVISTQKEEKKRVPKKA